MAQQLALSAGAKRFCCGLSSQWDKAGLHPGRVATITQGHREGQTTIRAPRNRQFKVPNSPHMHVTVGESQVPAVACLSFVVG